MDKIKEEKEIAKIKKDLIDYECKRKKELIEFEKKSQLEIINEKIKSGKIYHEDEKERMRIKSAEIRRSTLLRQEGRG